MITAEDLLDCGAVLSGQSKNSETGEEGLLFLARVQQIVFIF